MSDPRHPRTIAQHAPALISALCRFTVEQARDVYLALRERPRPIMLPRPALGERLSLFVSQHSPTGRVRQLKARLDALAERRR